MLVVSQETELEQALSVHRRLGKVIGLVPTMGSLHEGHLKLVKVAQAECDIVVVTIFVNPTQFAPNEDFDKYPRNFVSDCDKLESIGADILFAPSVDLIYPNGKDSCTKVILPDSYTKILCGRSRPHFFDGVAQVCTILFNIVKPDIAVFGEKDRQQITIVRKMVKDLHINIEIIGVPTVREANGLAMSSRNNYLPVEKLSLASNLFKMMEKTASAIKTGNHDYEKLCSSACQQLTADGFQVDYFEIRNLHDLSSNLSNDICIFTAAWLDGTRLIDNYPLPSFNNHEGCGNGS
ncbi:uncharacterized protein LOC107360915 [Tetranychus urticae]|uniref:Pantoate--beta-alanine ligase n=1 Tax=Tetranychus urticae TaxID=32264 RepID=A0A158P4N1_TETUR|nr:uncharacterized protein LOC107360915 [Tetranychus urticae]